MMANKLAESGNPKAAGAYYKAAAEYSPDLTDLSRPNEYFNEEVIFAKKDKELYRIAYRDYLKKNGNDKQELLTVMTEAALRDPTMNKRQLSDFYAASFAGGESFAQYWHNAINNRYAKAPVLAINKTDGTAYSPGQNTGKWTLIDFWATWCPPCREEHPDLQKLYLKTLSGEIANLNIMTVVCDDNLKNVKKYMAEFKFTYPIAMDDKVASRQFNVHGYPTKILITPEGKYLTVPFNNKWVDFIEQYIGNK